MKIERKQFGMTRLTLGSIQLMSRGDAANLSTKDQAQIRQHAAAETTSNLKEAAQLVKVNAPILKELTKLREEVAQEWAMTGEDQERRASKEAALLVIEAEYERRRKRAGKLRTEAEARLSKLENDALVLEARMIVGWCESAISEATELQADAEAILEWKAKEFKGKLRKGIAESVPDQLSFLEAIEHKDAKKLKAPYQRLAYLEALGISDHHRRYLLGTGFSSGRMVEMMIFWMDNGKTTGLVDALNEQIVEQAEPELPEGAIGTNVEVLDLG